MKTKTLQRILFAFTLLFALTFLSPPMAHADTDGTEIQVVQPERLEIQLGTAWAGVEFQLRTDSGLYPDPIPVGEDGVLRLEIGGSSSYSPAWDFPTRSPWWNRKITVSLQPLSSPKRRRKLPGATLRKRIPQHLKSRKPRPKEHPSLLRRRPIRSRPWPASR